MVNVVIHFSTSQLAMTIKENHMQTADLANFNISLQKLCHCVSAR